MAAHHADSTSSTPSRVWHWLTHPALFLSVAVVLLVFFLWWLIFVIGPVVGIEIKYRLATLTNNVFGTTQLSSIFFPRTSIDVRGLDSENREGGIIIPKIYVDEPVIYNVDPNDPRAYNAALRQGIAHASGTSFPDNGNLGYYFAHSSAPEFRSQYNAVFYLLGKLEPGDEVFLWHEGKRYEYAVSWVLETTPDNVEFLKETYDKETIVLQTCWPAGTTRGRLLIFAQRVPNSS